MYRTMMGAAEIMHNNKKRTVRMRPKAAAVVVVLAALRNVTGVVLCQGLATAKSDKERPCESKRTL